MPILWRCRHRAIWNLAYNAATGLAPTRDLSGQDLGGLTLTPGVYRFLTSAQLTGTLTLGALNDPNAYFVFQIGSTLTTADSSAVNFINGGLNSRLFWQAGSSATLGDGTTFAGNIFAQTSITMNPGASILCGRALARSGTVTMATNVISDDCAFNNGNGSGRSDFGSLGFSGTGLVPTPEPSTFMLCGFALTGLTAFTLFRFTRCD